MVARRRSLFACKNEPRSASLQAILTNAWSTKTNAFEGLWLTVLFLHCAEVILMTIPKQGCTERLLSSLLTYTMSHISLSLVRSS